MQKKQFCRQRENNLLKIDFGSGYNPKCGYKSCDITESPLLDYFYDYNKDIIYGLKEHSVDVFYIRNVIHHIEDLNKTFNVIKKYLKINGKIIIIDCNKENFKANVILDRIWYRFVYNTDFYISEYYRDYITLLKKLNFKLLSYKKVDEKEISVFKLLN